MKVNNVSCSSPAELEDGIAGSSSHDESSDNTGSEFATSSSSYQSGSRSKGGESLGQGETAAVDRSKCIVYLALLGAAVAVSTVTYLLLSKEEQNTMKIEFEAHSREILGQATANSVHMFEDMFAISKAITSHALDNGMTWPNVTIGSDKTTIIVAGERLHMPSMSIFTPSKTEGKTFGLVIDSL
ncbi:hypothetical protein IV203_007107 [Nitzschia inconspicua]|uniref:Uncharacterized protein n=1 Tax=Nitzschia inconspicua TaxID=303405 RepID=A0A9K3KF94_9STRA|nr:hypothetical protein IV203_007107 [Nitzschia inconspicua]